jgi:hypothetical protein
VIKSDPQQQITPANPVIEINQAFMSMSQFYLKKKSGRAMKKILSIKVKGSDLTGALTTIVKVKLDLADFLHKEREPVTVNLFPENLGNQLVTGHPDGSAKVSFEITVALPNKVKVDLSLVPLEEEKEDGLEEDDNSDNEQSGLPRLKSIFVRPCDLDLEEVKEQAMEQAQQE